MGLVHDDWQMDGRPMSGDIGVGATKAAVALAATGPINGVHRLPITRTTVELDWRWASFEKVSTGLFFHRRTSN